MGAPLCICNGLIRSGSTWSCNVCRELYQLLPRQNDEPVKSGYLEAVQLEHFVNQKWPTMTAPTVIKVHDIGPAAMGALRAGTARGICTFRDPRDCVVSDMAFMSYPFEACLKRIGGTLEPLRLYQSTPNILLIKYEQMMADRPREIRRIAGHLAIPVGDAAVQQIDARTNMHTSQRLCQSLKERPANAVMRVANHVVDPVTHLHSNHINGGAIGKWKFQLSVDQVLYMTEYFAPWLIKLGYETDASLNALLKNACLHANPGEPILSASPTAVAGSFAFAGMAQSSAQVQRSV
jgi:hypothetical protein